MVVEVEEKQKNENNKNISQNDKEILRRLAAEVAEIGALPVHQEKKELWKKLNGLERVKPLVYIYQIPWHEMNVNDELILQTESEFCRGLETSLRRTIYQWRHMPGDMVVEPIIKAGPVIHDTGFGIDEKVKVAKTDDKSNVVSRDFDEQIEDESDLDKIKIPEVTYDEEATERKYQLLQDIFADILEVKKSGRPGFWFAPWDELVRWWDVEKVMMDLILKPELVHKAMDRLVNAYLHRLDQYEELNLLGLNNGNNSAGSGGLNYTDELPPEDYNPQHIRPEDMWGCAAAQIFSDISPEMHEEFALKYEIKWMKRFGLNYYGCCEPLHKKVDILRQIPNLRKISMSPWVDVEEGARNIGTDYVFSRKPNPAILARDRWNLKEAREELKETLEKTKDCVVEVILKDISTVRYEPQRLWDWAEMASELTVKYA